MAAGEWTVEFHRFSNSPLPSSYSYHSLDLRLPSRSKLIAGTWIPPAFPATLRLHSGVLSVLLDSQLYEEHYVSNLQISWPKRYDSTLCTATWSSVIFFSFINCSNQVEMFAVAFSSEFEVQTCLDIIKENQSDVVDPEEVGFSCETLSSFIMDSHQIQHSVDSCIQEVKIPEVVLSEEEAAGGSPLQPQLANATEQVPLSLPPSFTDLLNECKMDSETSKYGQSNLTDGLRTSHTETLPVDSSLNEYVTPSEASFHEVSDIPPILQVALNPKLVEYMSNASFNNMLATIEGVIAEFGNDMVL